MRLLCVYYFAFILSVMEKLFMTARYSDNLTLNINVNNAYLIKWILCGKEILLKIDENSPT